MGEYSCIFYETIEGRSPVEAFIESLDEQTQINLFLRINYYKTLAHDYGIHIQITLRRGSLS